MINWAQIPNFTPGEFSEDPDRHAEPDLIHTLQTYRDRINHPVYPSPVKGALARFRGSRTSQHYSDLVRKSQAIDVFAEGVPASNFIGLTTIPKIRGIGIYLDTNGPDGLPWVMFHMDIRKHGFTADIPLIWICRKSQNGNQYYYPQKDLKYWALLQHPKIYQTKYYGK